MVFATTFFKENDFAVLPAIFLEIPMVLAILPLRAWVARCGPPQAPPEASAAVGAPDGRPGG